MQNEVQRRFSVSVDGVRLLLPAGELLEFVDGAAVHPLPRAGRRVAGLVQLRGHPVVVVDGRRGPVDAAPTLRAMPVLIVGSGPDAGGLVVDAPPEEARPGAERAAAPPPCAFPDALGKPLADEGRNGGLLWPVEPQRLFAVLAEA